MLKISAHFNHNFSFYKSEPCSRNGSFSLAKNTFHFGDNQPGRKWDTSKGFSDLGSSVQVAVKDAFHEREVRLNKYDDSIRLMFYGSSTTDPFITISYTVNYDDDVRTERLPQKLKWGGLFGAAETFEEHIERAVIRVEAIREKYKGTLL